MWFDILKFFGPREFLEHFKEQVGGEIIGGISSNRMRSRTELSLNHEKGYLKVSSIGSGEYHINMNGEVIASGFNLRKLIPLVESRLR